MVIRYLFTAYLLLLLGACADDEARDVTPQNSGEIKVNITTGAMPIPEVDNRAEVDSRTTIDNLRILLFDENDIYLGKYTVTENNLVALPFSESKRTVYVIANTATRIDNSTWTETTTTLDDIRGSLIQELLVANDNPDAIPNARLMPAMPPSMYASLEFPEGIDRNSSISSDGTLSGSPLLLKRNVAKITVALNPAINRLFTIKRIMLCNAPSMGYIVQDKIVSKDPNCNYTLYDYSGATPPSIYSYVAGKNTTIIIELSKAGEQSSSFYKMAIKSSQAEGAIGLRHNTFYRIQIVSISGSGFASLQGAIDGNVLDNIGSTLEIRDITMHDYIFSKDYYIATSNSKYTQYGSKDDREAYYDVSEIRFGNNSADPSFPSGTATSIDIKGIDGSDIASTIELDIKTIADISNAQNNTTYPIRIKLLKNLTAKVSAIITLHFDELTKQILVELQPELAATDNQFIPIENVVTIYVDDEYANWAGVNDINIFTTNKYLNFGTAEGWQVYVTLRQNANLTQAREVDVYSTKGVDVDNEFELYDLGRSKTHIIQRPND